MESDSQNLKLYFCFFTIFLGLSVSIRAAAILASKDSFFYKFCGVGQGFGCVELVFDEILRCVCADEGYSELYHYPFVLRFLFASAWFKFLK